MIWPSDAIDCPLPDIIFNFFARSRTETGSDRWEKLLSRRSSTSEGGSVPPSKAGCETVGTAQTRLCSPYDIVVKVVGWVERLVRRSSTSEGGSDTHQIPARKRDGLRCALPILLRGLRRLYFRPAPCQLDRHVRRRADDPRAAISVGRAALGQAPDRFQKQHVFSASMAFPVLRWSHHWSGETQVIHEPAMLPDVDFRTFSRKHKMASSVG